MWAVESSERKSDTATAGSSPPKPPLNRCDSMTAKMNEWRIKWNTVRATKFKTVPAHKKRPDS